jgi:hypothetical protein
MLYEIWLCYTEFEWNLLMLHKVWLDLIMLEWNLTKLGLIRLCWNLIMLHWVWVKYAYVPLSFSGNWLCCYNLIMLPNFQCPRLYYIFCIIHHVVNICGVGVGFTSPSEHMCRPFGNNAPHIKLWGASFQNCPAYFG